MKWSHKTPAPSKNVHIKQYKEKEYFDNVMFSAEFTFREESYVKSNMCN